MVGILVDANNLIYIRRDGANNQIRMSYEAGGVLLTDATAPLANLDFATYGMTWDISAGVTGEVHYYIDGVTVGGDVALGTWVGDLSNAAVVIGAASTVPASVWSGNEGPVLLYNTVKTPAEIAYLSTV